MTDLRDELMATIEAATEWLRKIGREEAGQKPGPDRWSRQQILGHLIDSAANNHQRFVRAQLSAELSFPAYQQEEWVASQRYGEASWPELIEFWRLYNLHLAHLIGGFPAEKLQVECRIGTSEPMTLEALATDYLRHLKHHLKQLEARV
jgi:hypothetical protein